MKERISRRVLSRLEKHMPAFVRRWQLQILTNLAGKSFGLPARKISKGSAENALAQYAAFTCEGMSSGSIEETKLFLDARRLGNRIRKITGLTDDHDINRLIILLYQNIGIKMTINDGSTAQKPEPSYRKELTISNCYFSKVYSPEQCKIMSNVDGGIVSGICGGGRLTFDCRITEGCDCCHAYLHNKVQLHRGSEHE